MNRHKPQSGGSDDLWIGGWRVHASRNRISLEGNSVRLEPRTMAVLLRLADQPGEVVTREQLEAAIWPGMVIGYDTLSNTVTKLRKAFGDDPKRPHLIETIPKVGYRLIADVKSQQPASGTTPRRWATKFPANAG